MAGEVLRPIVRPKTEEATPASLTTQDRMSTALRLRSELSTQWTVSPTIGTPPHRTPSVSMPIITSTGLFPSPTVFPTYCNSPPSWVPPHRSSLVHVSLSRDLVPHSPESRSDLEGLPLRPV